MKLTPNFRLNEFTRSSTASRYGKVVQPDVEQFCNTRILTYSCLQPLREAIGQPIRITSGIRPDWLNKLVNGSINSAHLTGRAADFVVPSYSPNEVVAICKDIGIPYDKIISEFGRWVHVQIADIGSSPREQAFIAYKHNGETLYEPY